jgi:hypothetical protein
VQLILDDLDLQIEENRQLQEYNTELNLQNDSLLQQNILLNQRLHLQ